MKLKIWNGRDWDCSGGRLYVAAHSIKDAVHLSNAAFRKVKGLANRPDVAPTSECEVRKYWSKGCWGIDMKDVTPERGVWWTPQEYGPRQEPIRRIM